jgi:diaminopimelate decarboxylase
VTGAVALVDAVSMWIELRSPSRRFGTPVYVLDEDEVRNRCRAYKDAFLDTDILYAAKAFLCRAMATWIHQEGLGLDLSSAGELELAVTTGFPPVTRAGIDRLRPDGNGGTPAEADCQTPPIRSAP